VSFYELPAFFEQEILCQFSKNLTAGALYEPDYYSRYPKNLISFQFGFNVTLQITSRIES
jgi:hypothetical protein